MVYKVFMNLIIHFTRIGYLHWLIDFPSLIYLKKVTFPIIFYTLLSVPLPFIISQYSETLLENLLLVTFTVCECIILGLLFLMNNNERRFVVDKLRSVLHVGLR